MRVFFVLLNSLVTLFFASHAYSEGHFGIEFVPGTATLGIPYTTDEFGVGIFGGIENNNANTSTTTVGFWLEKRHSCAKNTFFAWGVDGHTTMGKINDVKIKTDFTAGPYVSIQYYLTEPLMLTAWSNIISYNSKTMDGATKVNTTRSFANSLGITYYFK